MKDAEVDRILVVLAQRIKERRKVLGITQEDLAERSGLSPNYVARLELRQKSPSINTLACLARALDVPVSYLLSDIEESKFHGEAEEISHMLEGLSEGDSEYALSQLRTTIEHLKRGRR